LSVTKFQGEVMENAQTYRKLANDCRVLANRELNIRQRGMLWMAVGARDILAERAEHGEQEQAAAAVTAQRPNSARMRQQRQTRPAGKFWLKRRLRVAS
jgi:hypothetical protein